MHMAVGQRSTLLKLSLHVSLALLLVSVALVPVAASSSLYHPEHLENARRNVEQHDWARQIVRGWEGSVSYAMQQDREFFEELISELTFGTFYGQNCPACLEKKQAVMGEYGLLRWSIGAPDQLDCRRCGTAYPSDAHPETGVLECPRMGQTFTYYQTPEERALGPDATAEQRAEHALGWLQGGKRPQMTSFTGMIRGEKNRWAWAQMLTLAKLYAVTDDIAYAERAAWILDRFARVFPNYLYHSYDGSYADWPPAEVAASMGDDSTPNGGRFPPNAIRHAYDLNQHSDEQGDYSTLYNGFWGAGRLFAHAGSDAVPLRHMTVAFDLIRHARYPDGRPLLDEQMQQRIIEDLLIAGATDVEHWDDVSNNGMSVYALSAALGTLLEQPERVRHALNGLNRMLAERYHFDGFYAESPHYASWNFFHVGPLVDALYGYSDPLDYQPRDGQRIENLNPFASGDVHLVFQAAVRMIAPPGDRIPAIGNTRHTDRPAVRLIKRLDARIPYQYAGLMEAVFGIEGVEYALWYRPGDADTDHQIGLPLRSEWFPGWHVGVLRGASGVNDTALYLNGNEHRWTRRTGHRQRDILGISYFAFERELASDRGYFSGSGQITPDGRSGQVWTASTRSHNLVVVDEQDQTAAVSGSNLELFGVAPGVEVVQASGFNVYPQCDQYRRTCALIQSPDGHSYVVDLFRVTGGHTHQYSFHCNGSLVELKPAQPAPHPVELPRAWSEWLDKPRAVAPDEPYTFTWEYDDVRLDLMLLNSADTVDRIIIADAPGWRTHPESVEGREPIQHILAETRAVDEGHSLASQYAALMVPYSGDASPVLSSRLLANDPDSGIIAVEVRFAERTDYIISTMDQEQRQYGAITAAGEFAFISLDARGRVLQAYLLAGTLLQQGDTSIVLQRPTTRLAVASVSDRTFHLAEPLPADILADAAYLLADGPLPIRVDDPRPRTGFQIESATAATLTVRDYPVIDCDEVTLLHSAWLRSEW